MSKRNSQSNLVILTGEDVKAFNAMVDEMNKATDNAERSIDETLEYVAASNKRIEAMEKKLID